MFVKQERAMLNGRSTTAAQAVAAPSVRASFTPMKPLTPHENEALRAAVKKLSDALFRERFGSEPPPWSKQETEAFNTFLRNRGFFGEQLPAYRLPLPTLADIENCVRARFASEGISAGDQAYTWLAELEKYKYGPLNQAGIPLSVVAADQAERDRQVAEGKAKIAAEAAERQAENREYQARRAAGIVIADLRKKRFTVWSPIGPADFQFLATRPETPTAGLGIVVIVGNPETVAPRAGVTQAVVRRGSGTAENPINEKGDVTYIPDLNLK